MFGGIKRFTIITIFILLVVLIPIFETPNSTGKLINPSVLVLHKEKEKNGGDFEITN